MTILSLKAFCTVRGVVAKGFRPLLTGQALTQKFGLGDRAESLESPLWRWECQTGL